MGPVPCKPNFIDPAMHRIYRPASQGPVVTRSKWSQMRGPACGRHGHRLRGGR